MKSLNVVIIGTGMYVCGRGTDGYGTIIPALFEWKKENALNEVYIAGTNPAGLKIAKSRIRELGRSMNINISIRYFPQGKRIDPECYKQAVKNISRPACAIIAVPDNKHSEIAGYAMKEGLHVLVVKPLAATLKEARDLIKIKDRNKVYGAVEFHKRLDYANLALRNVIAKGLIGDPLYFIAEYSQRKSVPSERFIKWVRETNVFQYLGIHYVDVVYFATGAIPKRVMAIGQKGWLAKKGIDNYDSIQAIIVWEMPSGKKFASHILTNWIDSENTSAMSDQKIKVIGTKGRFESEQKKRGITIVTDDKGIEEPNPYFCSAFNTRGDIFYRGYGIDSIHQFLDDVVRIEKGEIGVNDLEDKRPTFKQSIVPTQVLEAINKSLKKNGEWVII